MKQFVKKALALGLLLSLCLWVKQTHSQEGNPYLTHFKLPNYISNQNWRFEQGENGLIYVLNQKGIYTFDGYTWDNLGVYGRPITMRFFKGNLFFCSDKGVGRFIQNSSGQYSTEIIIEPQESDYFYKLSILNDTLYASSPQTICSITVDGSIEVDTFYNETYKEVFLSDIFPSGGKLFHVKNRALVYKPKTGGGFEMVDGLPVGEDFLFSFIQGDDIYLGSNANKVYRFDGVRMTQFKLKDQDYLNASQLNGGISVDSETIALSTLNGGCLVVSTKDGKTISTLNLSQGLPDDEVYALGKDRDGGLWISHAMGITRADMRIPVRSFNYYPGLKGNVFSCLEFNNKFYVGCSDGLFILTETRDYRTVEVEDKQAKTPQKPAVEAAPEESGQQESSAVETKKKNFLSRLFTRKSKTEPDEEKLKRDTEDISGKDAEEEAQKSPAKRKIYQLQSISHSYRKIIGLDAKVKQLFVFKQSLFAATSTGLYEIIGERAQAVVPGMYIVFAQRSFLNQNALLFTTDRGAFLLEKVGSNWKVIDLFESDNQNVTSIVDVDENTFIITDEFDVFLIKRESENKFSSSSIMPKDTTFDSPLVRRIEGELIVFTPEKSFRFDTATKTLVSDKSFSNRKSFLLNFSQESYTWIKTTNFWELFRSSSDKVIPEMSFINLFENPINFYIAESGNIYIVNDYTQIYRISAKVSLQEEKKLSIFLKDVTGRSGKILDPGNIKLSYSENSLKVRISAPYYVKEGAVLFQYYIKGLTIDWSDWERSQVIDLPYLPSGKYTIQIRAKDTLGNTSEILELPYVVTPPFWKRPLFIIACIILVIILFVAIVVLRERSLKREKEILEEKVRERTQIIEDQNTTLTLQKDALERYNKEILQQKEEITAQRDEIEAQRDQIFKQNEEITKSIVYARRIQAAVMPSLDVVKSILQSYFLMFRPRDIVSGDFYWMSKKNGKTIVVASDCTGHGVPGAFMSMMGVSFLNDIVNVNGETRPDVILNNLREKIKTTLWQTGKEGETRDGMDIAICVFEPDGKKVSYAGAYNPLYLIRRGEFVEYKADKMPVGIHVKEKDSFTCHEVALEHGDNLYIFSDGYVSQFGGDDGKKFMAKPFKDLLVSISGKPMEKQKQLLEEAMDKWQGNTEQIDDILVIGIEIQ